MVEKIEEELDMQFKEILVEDGLYAEGEIEDEVELEGLWKSIKAKAPELNGRMGILLISKLGLRDVPKSDILKLIESITGE